MFIIHNILNVHNFLIIIYNLLYFIRYNLYCEYYKYEKKEK